MVDSFRGTNVQPPLLMAIACLWLLLVVPFLLPFSTLPVPSFYREWTAFALGCAMSVGIAWAQRAHGIAIPRSTLLPIGLCMLLLLQAGQGRLDYWQQGATTALYLLWSAVMLCAGSMLRQQLGWERFCTLAAWAIASGALFSAALGLLQLADWRAGGLIMPMFARRISANLGQSNHLADYLSLGLFSVAFLASSRRMNPYAVIAAMLLLLLVAEWSASRSVWAYLGVGLLLALWAHRSAKTQQTRVLLLWLVGALSALIAVSLVSHVLSLDTASLSAGLSRPESAAERLLADPEAVSHRLSIWWAAWQSFRDAPFAGVGFGGFAWAFYVLRGQLPAGLPEEITDNAHNIVLHLLAESGLPGAVLLIAVAVWWLQRRSREGAAAQRWWLLALLAVLVLHSLVEYPLWYAHFLGLFALLAGASERAPWRLKPASVTAVAVAAIGAVMLWLLSSAFLDYRTVERLGVESKATLDKAVIVEAAGVSGASLFGNFIELGLARTIALDHIALDAKLDLNGRVLRAYPAPDVAYRHSALHALNGDLAAAYRFWDLAASAYPRHAPAALKVLKARSAIGEVMLEPLVEYAASRSKEQQ